jgi:hypothetical protein
MKLRHFTLLFTMLLGMSSIPTFDHDFEAKNSDGVTIYYNFHNDKTELSVTFRGDLANSDHTKYTDRYVGHVAIPESVTYEGKAYPVTEIGYLSFNYCEGLTSVTIPTSVTHIEKSAFVRCKGLTSIDIPNSVIKIEDNAFAQSGITSVVIPKNVTFVGNNTFVNCENLAAITVAEDNPTYDSRDNCNAIIETETNKLVAGCKNSTIPNTVTSLGHNAFFSCKGLTSITIPVSVTSLGYNVFGNCEALTSITIPGSVTSIGAWAMYGSENLAVVHLIGNDALTIGENFLRNCDALTDVYYYKEKLPTIGDQAFYQNDLENVTLHVPAAAVDAFKAAEPWSSFKTVVPITEDDLAKVGSITAESTAGETRFTLSGQRIATPQKGVSIVKKGDKTVKVLAK